ncbi:MAG: GGDEF domain-containing protein [Lachnospiraceae bacterium]|nr:GGDEF domain-containing protein [Lachnospiraceae bacterium]
MQNLKGLIGRYMTIVTASIVFVIISVSFVVQMLDAQHEARTAADDMIIQMDSVLNNQWENVSEDEMSNIFTLLRVNDDVEYFAVDAGTNMVIGSTMQDVPGKNVADIGLKMSEIKRDKNGFHEKINGNSVFVVFKRVGEYWLGRSVTNKALYSNVTWNILGLAVCCILMGIVQVVLVTKYLNNCVVEGIQEVNKKLKSISDGKLTENVNVSKSLEFEELSQYINEMVRSLMAGNRRLSYVLSKSHMRIGTYEFNDFTKKVLVTEQIAPILELNEEEMEVLLSDKNEFKTYVNYVRRYVFDEEENVYYYRRYSEKYIRVEELYENAKTFGILIDVTDEILKRKQIEKERDIDLLTGLYNRRGLENQLEKLFKYPDRMGYGAIIMIDADGLKGINDKYGHEEGDSYIKKIGNIIKGFGVNEALASRQGGDEFVLVLYGYNNEEELSNTIGTLKYIQNNSTVHLSNSEDVPLQFSFGYTMFFDRSDYVEMMKEADEKMYADKRMRKNQK